MSRHVTRIAVDGAVGIVHGDKTPTKRDLEAMTAIVKAAKSRSGTPTTPNAKRRRKMVHLTLSDEALARLDAIASDRGQTRSGCVEGLIRNAGDGVKVMRAPPKKGPMRGTWTKRCVHCGRRGTKSFSYGYAAGWLCDNVDACASRHERWSVRGGRVGADLDRR